eukprot:m.136039 g.136039  ORF g.136039 m.136039 type:complete len:360 (+) comp9543_c0_seq3:1141-2220(+)
MRAAGIDAACGRRSRTYSSTWTRASGRMHTRVPAFFATDTMCTHELRSSTRLLMADSAWHSASGHATARTTSRASGGSRPLWICSCTLAASSSDSERMPHSAGMTTSVGWLDAKCSTRSDSICGVSVSMCVGDRWKRTWKSRQGIRQGKEPAARKRDSWEQGWGGTARPEDGVIRWGGTHADHAAGLLLAAQHPDGQRAGVALRDPVPCARRLTAQQRAAQAGGGRGSRADGHAAAGRALGRQRGRRGRAGRREVCKARRDLCSEAADDGIEQAQVQVFRLGLDRAAHILLDRDAVLRGALADHRRDDRLPRGKLRCIKPVQHWRIVRVRGPRLRAVAEDVAGQLDEGALPPHLVRKRL